MRKSNLVLSVIFLFTVTLFFQSCEKDNPTPKPVTENILPEEFTVEIPQSIKLNELTEFEDRDVDTLQGNVIYRHLMTFVAVGDFGAATVSAVIHTLRRFNINGPMSFTFTSDKDGRLKQIDVVEDSEFEGTTWQYELEMKDIDEDSETTYGGKAVQIFWNRNPVVGVAIFNPHNINRVERNNPDLMYRVDYNSASDLGYTKHMIVSLSGLVVANPLEHKYDMSTLKMFVGKKGEIIDLYGNSNHPNATFFNGDAGFNWAFAASGSRVGDLAVAEVGLPRSTADISDRQSILVDNSIENVFSTQIFETWPDIDSTSVSAYLYNTQAPGFFDLYGFIQAGTAPDSGYSVYEDRILDLTPYNPKEISELELEFK